MPVSESSPANSQGPPNRPSRDRIAPEAFRMLDWTNADTAPSAIDVARMAGFGGPARFAVLVNTPRMLRAASVFAEQAGLQGSQVRVFVDAKEAQAWLYKDMPIALLGEEWPDSHPKLALPPIE